MNELIEQLTDRFETECHLSFDCIERENFGQAIQTACKAQRNACAGAVECMVSTQAINKILTTEIRKEDYE